ncbi:hypothetical protein COM13_26735 [Bacillus pseudomycoides]|uniref:hypothetical protein n=1 Tax=Bacillus pseudomycoides TaxID=64104 RepID=UPI000BEC6A90|nr:hypothetical protein [Bacillus pseudomycoides]PDY02087.1 hypothetical protein COO07_02645 [Bacillus pseudomycoides]PEK81822.1 hypothetical protein CN597_04840 [Bacillus pseudomycoides]PEN06331.1 hypothetical protein CN640_18320 [Bacillus pseudomycoides]PGB78815.1 hypothetical protein COM13_26735 [Bacillus pseudomycoides]PHE55212.1 hypothetical protein COF52_16340 [Bacillus pseudomycoides]
MGAYRDFLLRATLYVYVFLYLFICIAFIFIIGTTHSSYNTVSILVVSIPFILLLALQWIVFHFSGGNNKGIFKSITIVGAVLFSICIVQLGVNKYNSKFQTDRWLKDERKRVYMIDDLLTKHKLVGKPKKEIVQLLGKPTETRRFEEMNQTVYYLGDERGFIPIDSEWLILQFDNDDKVVEHRLYKD